MAAMSPLAATMVGTSIGAPLSMKADQPEYPDDRLDDPLRLKIDVHAQPDSHLMDLRGRARLSCDDDQIVG
jgi:hypothetical protein